MGKKKNRKNKGTFSRYQLSNINSSFCYPKIVLYNNIWEYKYIPPSYIYTTTKYSRFRI